MHSATVLLCFLVAAAPALSGPAMVRPGILNNLEELQFIQGRVAANQLPWKSAYDALKTSRYASISVTPRPYATVACGSYNNPNVGCDEMVEDGLIAYTQALLWWLSGNRRHADNAVAILKAWTSTYVRNTESNARLVVSWAVPWYANAAEILRHSPSGWSEADVSAFARLLKDKLLPYTLDETMPGNNWIQSAIEAHMAIAVFTDDRALLEAAAARWRLRVRTYIYQASDGPVPVATPGKTPDQMRNIWKGESAGTAYVDGLAMETCRDLGHLGLGFRSMMYAAQTAWLQGIDLIGPERERIADFLELHARWMMGLERVPADICGGRILIDPRTTLGSGGGGAKGFEIAYNHIAVRLGKSLPATQAMVRKCRPEGAGLWVAKWETLTHGDLPFLGGNTGLRPRKESIRGDSETGVPSLAGTRTPYFGVLRRGAWYRLDGVRHP